MKTFIIALLIGSSFLTSNAQVASVIHSDSVLRDSSSKSKSISPNLKETKKAITIGQLSQNIANCLDKSDLLRKNNKEGNLILEVFVFENGDIHSNKTTDSNSEIMSKLILDMMKSVDAIKLDKKMGKGISKIKVPVHYSL